MATICDHRVCAARGGRALRDVRPGAVPDHPDGDLHDSHPIGEVQVDTSFVRLYAMPTAGSPLVRNGSPSASTPLTGKVGEFFGVRPQDEAECLRRHELDYAELRQT